MTSLLHDIVVWSTKAKSLVLIELITAKEEWVEAALEHREASYSDLGVVSIFTGLNIIHSKKALTLLSFLVFYTSLVERHVKDTLKV